MKSLRLILFTTIALTCLFAFNITAWSQDLSFRTTCPSPWVPTASFDSDIDYPLPGPLNNPLTENEHIFSINSAYNFYIWATGYTTPLQGLYANIYTTSVHVELPTNPFSGQLANTGNVWMYLFHYGNDAIDITVYDENNVSIPFTRDTKHHASLDIFNVYIEADDPLAKIARIEYSFPHNESLLIKLCAY